MYSFSKTVWFCLAILFMLPTDVAANNSKSFWDTLDNLQQKGKKVRDQVDNEVCYYSSSKCNTLPEKDQAGKNYRQPKYINPSNTPANFGDVLTIGHVIGDKTPDAISYMEDDRSLVIFRGASRKGKVNFSNSYRHYPSIRLGKNDKVVVGDFWGTGCAGVLLYSKSRFKSRLYKTQRSGNRCNTQRLKLTHSYPYSSSREIQLISPRVEKTLNRFIGMFSAKGAGYLVHTGDVDQDGRDDIILTGGRKLYNKRVELSTLVLYANHPRNRGDNLQFGQSPKGYKVQIHSVTKALKGEIVRVGDVLGDSGIELINIKNDGDINAVIYSFKDGRFKKHSKKTVNATGISGIEPESFKLYDYDGDGKDDVVIAKSRSQIEFQAAFNK